MTTKIDVIDEVSMAYTLTTRAVRPGTGECLYLTGEGKKCALGRYLTKNHGLFEGKNARGIADTYGLKKFQDSLREDVRNFPIDFWTMLQHLHDTPAFWDDYGLSAAGRIHVILLRRYWSEN